MLDAVVQLNLPPEAFRQMTVRGIHALLETHHELKKQAMEFEVTLATGKQAKNLFG